MAFSYVLAKGGSVYGGNSQIQLNVPHRQTVDFAETNEVHTFLKVNRSSSLSPLADGCVPRLFTIIVNVCNFPKIC